MPEEPKRPLKVFLCHAHADRDPVRGLYSRLTKDGVDAWLDKEKLFPGQDWELEIRKAVREADVVVVCLSKQFNQAGFRQKEVRLALDTAMEQPEGEIFIIPARLEECDTLESLRKWHWVDLFEDNGYQNLLRAFSKRAIGIGRTVSSKKDIDAKPNESGNKQNTDAIGNKTKPSRLGLGFAIGISLFAGFCAFCLFIWGLPYLQKGGGFNSTAAPTQNRTASAVATDFVTSVSSETSIPLNRITPTIYSGSLPIEINDSEYVPMRLIPEGLFIMGSYVDQAMIECMKYYSDCQRGDFIDQPPPHEVYLDSYYIDKYEVTNELYKHCVDANVCQKPNDSTSRYENAQFADHPVVFVDWKMAKEFCEWRNTRLPTEAEWEKAARGTDGRPFPWGTGLGCEYANYFSTSEGTCKGGTTPVGSYELGKSQYGVYDLAGNAWEWVSSLAKAYPYDLNDGREDPINTSARILRGGGYWNFDYYGASSTFRYPVSPTEVDGSYGFRCARDAMP